MFRLIGNNSYNDAPKSLGAIFLLGTGAKVTGAVLAIIRTGSTDKLTFPTPPLKDGLITLDVPSGVKSIEAVEWDGVRYTATTGELQPGEFFWDKMLSIIWIKPWQI